MELCDHLSSWEQNFTPRACHAGVWSVYQTCPLITADSEEECFIRMSLFWQSRSWTWKTIHFSWSFRVISPKVSTPLRVKFTKGLGVLHPWDVWPVTWGLMKWRSLNSEKIRSGLVSKRQQCCQVTDTEVLRPGRPWIWFLRRQKTPHQSTDPHYNCGVRNTHDVKVLGSIYGSFIYFIYAYTQWSPVMVFELTGGRL